MALTISPAELQKSAQKFRKELFIVPMLAAEATLKHFTPHLDLDGDVTLGQLTGDIQLAPFKADRGTSGEGKFAIAGRKLEIFLGNCADRFNPNAVWGSIYGSKVLHGDGLKNVNIAKAILSFTAACLGRNLNLVLWNAKENPVGDTTKELFNGLDTITAAEIEKNTIGTPKKNYKEVAKITSLNAVEIIESIMDDLAPELISSPCKLFTTPDVVRNYERDYRERFGGNTYNKQYEKFVVEGTAGMVELVPLASKAGSEYIHICPKSNVHYGCGGGHYPNEGIEIRKYNSWLNTIETAMAFGLQFESLSPEVFFTAKVAKM